MLEERQFSSVSIFRETKHAIQLYITYNHNSGILGRRRQTLERIHSHVGEMTFSQGPYNYLWVGTM